MIKSLINDLDTTLFRKGDWNWIIERHLLMQNDSNTAL